jgi:hypothetical protein
MFGDNEVMRMMKATSNEATVHDVRIVGNSPSHNRACRAEVLNLLFCTFAGLDAD